VRVFVYLQQNIFPKQELEMDLKLEVLRKEVNQFRSKSARASVRLLALIELVKYAEKWSRLGDGDYEKIGARFEVSGRTLRRWAKSYQSGGAKALVPRKACGRKAKAIRGKVARHITQWRKLYNWGAEVISAHLEYECGVWISQYRINRFLRRKKLLKRKRSYKPKKKHTRVVTVLHLGQHTQIDVKYLLTLLGNGRKCYQYSFVDHASKWRFKRAYESFGPSETRQFMLALLRAAPFAIKRLQSDNGVEFTNKYLSHLDAPKKHVLDEICEANGIRHALIPPGEKELQGLVERSHRQDDEELFHRIKPADLDELNRIIEEHCAWANSKRRRKNLGWKTSDEFIADYKKNHTAGGEKIIPIQLETQIHNQTTEEAIELIKKAA
jgi:transposase